MRLRTGDYCDDDDIDDDDDDLQCFLFVCLFVCLFVSCMPKAVLFREVGKTYIKARVRFESVFS